MCEKPNINVIYSSVRYLLYLTRVIQLRLKDNNKPKSLSKTVVKVVSCKLFQEIHMKLKYCLLPSIRLTRPRKEFNLYYLREISMVFKMAVLTPKSGIQWLLYPLDYFLTSHKAITILFKIIF